MQLRLALYMFGRSLDVPHLLEMGENRFRERVEEIRNRQTMDKALEG